VKGVQGFVAKNQSALYQAIGKPIGEIQHISGNHIFPMTMHIKDILHVLDEPPRPDYTLRGPSLRIVPAAPAFYTGQ
jgi:hypothetical protein